MSYGNFHSSLKNIYKNCILNKIITHLLDFKFII